MSVYEPVILAEQKQLKDFVLDPLTKKISLGRWEREDSNKGMVDTLRQALSQRLGVPVSVPLSLMNAVQELWVANQETITVTLASQALDEKGRVTSYQLIDIEPGDGTHFNVGLAIDIGTTTVVVYLVDMVKGDIGASSGL